MDRSVQNSSKPQASMKEQEMTSTANSAAKAVLPADSAGSDLFQPVKLGAITLANRIVMAPLTRSRANKDDAPYGIHVEYYAQRASAGLIITEATQISQQGKGYA